MNWVESKSVQSLCPEFAEIFVGREAFEGPEFSGEVVGCDKVVQVRFELLVRVIEKAFDCGFLDRPAHAFDLPVGSWRLCLVSWCSMLCRRQAHVKGMAAKACEWPLAVRRSHSTGRDADTQSAAAYGTGAQQADAINAPAHLYLVLANAVY